MLRIRTLGASLLAVAGTTGIALAADLPNYEPPPAAAYSPAPAWSWTGPYAGLTGGYAWGGTSTGGVAVPSNGWVGGGFVGYNLQTNTNLVVGLEGDFTFTNKTGTGGTPVTTVNNPWNGTFRGRLGYAFDRFMIYGTGGLAVGALNSSAPSESTTKVGWTAGVGLEAALTDKITGRIEYRHTNLGTFPSTGTAYTSNDVMVGVAFKF